MASARRLAVQFKVKCLIAWEWGDIHDYFERMEEVEFTSASTFSGPTIDHTLDGNPIARVPLDCGQVVIRSGSFFWGDREKVPPIAPYQAFRTYLPRPSQNINRIMDAFAPHGLDAVGFHVRRCDHTPAKTHSPDEMFIEAGQKLIASGRNIFLSTDNQKTEEQMRAQFGSRLLFYPKRTALAQRWPRRFDRVATEDDVVDLFLLGRTQFIVGSYRSSYSQLALMLNGSAESYYIERPDLAERRLRLEKLHAKVRRYLPFLAPVLFRRWSIDVRRYRRKLTQALTR